MPSISKISIKLLCATLLLVSACSFPKSTTPPPEEVEALQRWEAVVAEAHEAYDRGEYVKAEQRWQIALQAAETFGPDSPRVATSLNNLGMVYRREGRYAEAKSCAKERWRSVRRLTLIFVRSDRFSTVWLRSTRRKADMRRRNRCIVER